jgi:sulfoxide reductase heme-binding subunit YedZ
MLGLFAFFYATMHLLSYIAFDRFFAFGEILKDIAKRPFITAGMVAFAAMVPLAVTSTKGWIRRLGRRWQQLHRLIYLSAMAAALHFIWKVKVPFGEPVYYAAIAAVLLIFRIVWRVRSTSRVRLSQPSVH